MKAKVTKEFPGRADHEPFTRIWPVGAVIEGELAASAVSVGFAVDLVAPDTADEKPAVPPSRKKGKK